MKNTCVPGYLKRDRHKLTNRVLGESCNVLLGPRVVRLITHATYHNMGSPSDSCAQGDPAVTVDWWVRDGVTPRPSLAPPQLPSHSPPMSPGQSKSTPDQHDQPGGKERAVSSSLFISVWDLWSCFASLFLYVMIKYCLSAQLIPKAKGKSLCPHIICKLSPSPRTDLFTGRESVLYYPAVTLPCLSSLFSVMPSHSRCSVWGLHISFLKGENVGDKNIFEW